MPPREGSMAKAQVRRHLRRPLHSSHDSVRFNHPPAHEIPDSPFVKAGKAALILGDYLRIEARLTVARHVDGKNARIRLTTLPCQPGNHRGRQAGRLLAEQGRQGLLEVAGRNSAQIQRGQ